MPLRRSSRKPEMMPPLNLKKSILYSTGVAAAAFALLALMSTCAKKPPPTMVKEKRYLVQALTVSVGKIRPKVSVFGTIQARNHVTLTSPVGAELLEIRFLEGERFDKGEQLVRLDLRDIKLQRDESLATAEEIIAQIKGTISDGEIERRRLADTSELLELAKKQYERAERLLGEKVIPQSQFETSETAYKQREIDYLNQQQKSQNLETQRLRLEAQKKRIESQRGQLDIQLEQARMRAPFSGTVLEIFASVGDRLSAGTPVVEIFDPDSLILRASVPNSHLARMATSDNPQVWLPEPSGKTLTLGIDYLKPEITAGQGSAETIIKLPKGPWILGSITELDIILDFVEDSVALPYEALYSNNRIFRIDSSSRAESLECDLLGLAGIEGDGSEILLQCGGLKTGDVVIQQQIPNLATGFKINILGQ